MITDTRQPWQMTLAEYAKTPDALRVPARSILATRPATLTAAYLEDRSRHELQALALALGAPYGGTKAELIARVTLHNDARQLLTHATASSLLATFKGATLRHWLRELHQYIPCTLGSQANSLIHWRDKGRTLGKAFLASAKHRAHVGRALRRGEPVPPEVIRDHPDMALRIEEEQPLFSQIVDPEPVPAS